MSNKSFSLKFKGDARNTGSMRNDIDVSFESMNEKFKLATDEGAFHGGKGTAPPPLALFTASLCGCVMTQIKAFGKKLKIEVDEIKNKMLKDFYYDSKKVSNKKIKDYFDYSFKFPSYIEGLKHIRNNFI